MVLKQCHSCTRKFTKTEHLKRHQRSHTNERPYKCGTCRKCFSRSDVLHRHRKCHEDATKSTSHQTRSSFSGIEQSNEVPIDEDEYRHNTSELLLPESTSPSPSQQSPRQGSSQSLRSDTRLSVGNPGTKVLQLSEMSSFPSPAQSAGFNLLDQPLLNHSVFLADQQHNMQDNAVSEAGQDEILHMNSSDFPQIPTPNLYTASPLSHTWLSSIQPETAIEQNIELTRRETEDPFGLCLPADNYPYDSLQSLLFPSAPLDFPAISYENVISPSQPRHVEMEVPYSFPSLTSVDYDVASKEIPSERYERVHRCWPTLSENTTSLAKDFVLYDSACQGENIFSVLSTESGNPISNHQHGSCRGLDNSCYLRLKMEFDTSTIDRYLGFEEPSASSSQSRRYDFPSAGLLDIALDLYFQKFHPTLPFVHIPTFCAKMTPSPLLFTMCLIGLSVLRTNGATEFVAQSFPILLRKVCSDLVSVPSHPGPHLGHITTVATALLVVNLSGVMGDQRCLAVTKFLYANLFSFSQQYGFFTTEWQQSLNVDLSQDQESKHQWMVWSRAESLRRLVATLAILDSWCSDQLSISPMIRTNTLQIILPYEEALFSAESATSWTQVLDSGKSLRTPTETSFFLDRYPLEPEEHLDTFSLFSLLCITRIRISESYHRLLPPSEKNHGEAEALIPCELFAKDLVASHLVSLSTSLIYIKTVGAQESDLNNMILWNHLCLFLTSNFRVFERAAGKEGKFPAKKSIRMVALWAQTPAARRACLHAAQIFTLVSNRKFSDSMKVRLDTVPALFMAALVLSLYAFTFRPTMPHGSDKSLELLDQVDWQLLGTLGMDDCVRSTSTMIEHHSRDNNADYPAAQFIKYGGHVTFSGNIISGDYHSARKVLLDFATLIEGLGKSNSLPSSEVLHIMADTLMYVEHEIP